MKITDMEVIPLLIPYNAPYETANGIQKYGNKVIVKLHTDEGITGIGETCHINPDHTGELIEMMAITLVRYFKPHIIGKDPFKLEDILLTPRRFTHSKYSFTFCLSAVDCALYDLMGKAWNTPVYNLLGGLIRSEITVARSIPSKPPAEMAEAALKVKEQGYRLITFKGGFGAKIDIDRLKAVREALGPDFPLEADFNQGYRPDESIPLIKEMQKYGICAIEQPGPWWDIDGMAEVRQAVDVPIIAHESVLYPVDVMNIARKRAADVICLTLPKNGCFRNGFKMVAIAEAAGMTVSMASEHPAGIGTAALRHFVAALPMVEEPIGYGCPLERFAGDILTEDLAVENGVVRVPEGPGLGVELDDEKVEKYKAHYIAEMLEIVDKAER